MLKNKVAIIAALLFIPQNEILRLLAFAILGSIALFSLMSKIVEHESNE